MAVCSDASHAAPDVSSRTQHTAVHNGSTAAAGRTHVRVAARIFMRDLKRIFTNPVATVIAIGVCIIPSLYAWFNILANWDPYGNTSTVPIAVAIEDRGADISDMGYTNAGDMIRDQLEENTQLKWTLVDEGEALEGVRSGAYYAAFVVPEDFTSSLADVLEGDTQQAHIAYYVNEKANAVAPKVTDTGATTLETQIANQFVNVVGKTVTEKLQTATNKAAGDIDSATRGVATDLHDINDELTGLSSDLSDAQGTISDARATVQQARDSLATISGTASSMTDSLQGALDTLSGTRTKAQSLASKLGAALGTGSSTIASISSTANYDIGQITGGVGWATGKLDAAIAQIKALNGTTQSIKSTLEDTKTTITNIQATDDVTITFQSQVTAQFDSEIDILVQLSDKQLAQLGALQRLSDDIKSGNDAVSGLSTSVNDAVQSSSQALANLQSSLATSTMPQVSDALDSFSGVGSRLAGTASALSPMLNQADGTLAQLDAVLAQSADTISQTTTSVQDAADKVGTLATDADAIQSATTFEGIKDILALDPEDVGSYMGTPVEMVSQPVYPVSNYGSGVAPFYTNLALWVGGFVLVAIYKLEVDEEGVGHFKPWQGFFGRWMLMNLLGQVQAIICCVGDIVLGMQCLAPAAYVFAGMVQSFVYVFFVYAVSVAFKHIGKALGVLVVILQIPGASGVYPIELMPGFFQNLRPWLPFTYGINAMREAVAGFYGDYYVKNLLVLLVYLIPSLLIGVTARRHLLNVNGLFDRKLGETDLMITERVAPKGAHFRLSTLVKVLMNSDEYKQTFLERAAKFELMYPMLVRRGFAALIWVPLVLLALMFVLPAKFAFLVCWIVSLVAICAFLIVVEYFHSRVSAKTTLADMSRTELYGLLDDELRQEFMAFAPLDKMRLDRTAPRGSAASNTANLATPSRLESAPGKTSSSTANDPDVTTQDDNAEKGGDAR